MSPRKAENKTFKQNQKLSAVNMSSRRKRTLKSSKNKNESATTEPPRKRARLVRSKKTDREQKEDNIENEEPNNNHATTDNEEKTDSNSNSTAETKEKIENLYKLKVSELKELCRKKGLKVGGNKSQLIIRLLTPNAMQSKPQNVKGSKRTSVKQVHAMLKRAGVKDPESVNKCLKKGLQKGYYTIDEDEDGDGGLDKIIFSGQCIVCNKEHDVSIRDVLYQPACGHDYGEGGPNGAIQCDDCCGLYVTRLCEGNASFDCGKFHNHCTECSGFGKCIGDYREAHCDQCGKHYFCGLSGFACPNCERRGNRARFDDERDDCSIQ